MEYDDGIPMGDLSPPDRLRNVIWDRTAWNMGAMGTASPELFQAGLQARHSHRRFEMVSHQALQRLGEAEREKVRLTARGPLQRARIVRFLEKGHASFSEFRLRRGRHLGMAVWSGVARKNLGGEAYSLRSKAEGLRPPRARWRSRKRGGRWGVRMD